MKKILCVFLISIYSLESKSDICDSPPVAIEFLLAEYVFFGVISDKTYNQDSAYYNLEVEVLHHFKDTKKRPKTVKIKTKNSLPAYKSHFLIFAHQTLDGLVFYTRGSNSNQFQSLNDIPEHLLKILEAGNSIEADSILFDSHTLRNCIFHMKRPSPNDNRDSLIISLEKKTYKHYKKRTYEPFLLTINKSGELEKVIAIRNERYTFRRYYDIILSVFQPLPVIPNALQHDVIEILYRYKTWSPAIFNNQPVKYQVYFEVHFDKNLILKASIFD